MKTRKVFRKRKSRTRKSRRTKHPRKIKELRNVGRGIVKCCMCEKNVDNSKTDTFIPLNCLNKPIKDKAGVHRICSDCWWNPKTGFAKEGVSHKCPGCVKGLPVVRPETKSEVIDISD